MAINTKQRLLEARAAIKVKHYNKARELLKGVNHPKAREWLAKLEKRSRKSQKGPRLLLFINAAAFVAAIIFILMVVLGQPSMPDSAELTATAVGLTNIRTINLSPTVSPTTSP